MTGRVLKMDHPKEGQPANFINRMVNRMGEPVIRRAMYEAMKIMGKQFVLGRDINEALKRSKPLFNKGYTYSYDMLGEAARTRDDAKRYFDDYARAIEQVGKTCKTLSDKTRRRRYLSSSLHCIRVMSLVVESRCSPNWSTRLSSWSAKRAS